MCEYFRNIVASYNAKFLYFSEVGLDILSIRRGITLNYTHHQMTGNDVQLPKLIEPTTADENFGGVWLWLQTSTYFRKRGFRMEWEVHDPTTTTGPPAPPTKATKPPKGKDF